MALPRKKILPSFFVITRFFQRLMRARRPSKKFRSKSRQYLKSRALRSAQWGIEVVDPTNNQVLLSINSEKTFTPASVVKVLTTATALEKLGPDFRYKTGVYTNGVLQADGTLAGDLILVGPWGSEPAQPAGRRAVHRRPSRIWPVKLKTAASRTSWATS